MIDYNGKGFNDPIVRCEGCAKLVHRKYISKIGGCNHCGNKRFKSLRGLTGDEFKAISEGTYDFSMKSYTIDPDYLEMFEETEEI